MTEFAAFRSKMESVQVSEPAILSFERNYKALREEATGCISEQSIEPVPQLLELDSIAKEEASFSPELLAQTVVIKLNGGLGTSMGLQKAKSLLTVREGSTFLDIIVEQILHLRETSGAQVKFLLMNSFNTSEDTLRHLEDYSEQGMADAAEVELMQNQVPKIDATTFEPAACKANPSLEWCPPGHGDIYAALSGSGMLDKLLDQGVKYAFVSNSDN